MSNAPQRVRLIVEEMTREGWCLISSRPLTLGTAQQVSEYVDALVEVSVPPHTDEEETE